IDTSPAIHGWVVVRYQTVSPAQGRLNPQVNHEIILSRPERDFSVDFVPCTPAFHAGLNAIIPTGLIFVNPQNADD
ncbi:MAG: hypothetical protein N3A72_10465, partial [bacterium]|nr:hypothetical protein [bacterium]